MTNGQKIGRASDLAFRASGMLNNALSPGQFGGTADRALLSAEHALREALQIIETLKGENQT